MKVGEFWKALRDLNLSWEVDEWQRIRYEGMCPLEVVAKAGPHDWPRAREKLGLSWAIGVQIAAAADGVDNRFRKNLMKACRLESKIQ
jgi:hypothetical protein